MTSDEKYKRLLEIVEMINEIYPELDRLLVTDIDNPESVIVTSDENLQLIAGELMDGLGLEEVANSGKNDDDDKGNLH